MSCREYAAERDRAAAAAEAAAKEVTLLRSAQRRSVELDNMKLASEQEDQRRKAALATAEADAKTLATLNTPGAGMGMLAEDARDGVSSADPRRYRVDHYRGLSPSAAAETAQAVLVQAEARRRLSQEMKAAERDFAAASQRWAEDRAQHCNSSPA